VRALILTESFAITSRPDLQHHYDHIAIATRALLQSVWCAHASKIIEALTALNAASVPGPHKDQLLERSLKAHLIRLVSVGAKPMALSTLSSPPSSSIHVDAPALALVLLDQSTFVQDKRVGFSTLMEMETYEHRSSVQERIAAEWSATPEMLECYIGTISSLNTSDFASQIRRLMSQPYFNINQTHHSRTLARGLTIHRHRTVLTQEGRDLMVEVFTRIGKVNQASAYPILKCFDQVDAFEGEMKAKLIETMQAMQDSIDEVQEESLYNQLNIMLKKA
jgi:aminopeptidase N